MLVRFNVDFDKQFKERLSNAQKIQVLDSIDLFIDKPFHQNFRNHALKMAMITLLGNIPYVSPLRIEAIAQLFTCSSQVTF
jgi:hypothetical protein